MDVGYFYVNTCVLGFFFHSVKGALVSTVNGELWELGRPLEGDCELKFLGFDTVEGRQVITPIFCMCFLSQMSVRWLLVF